MQLDTKKCKIIVFLDIDGTLLDLGQKPTTKEIFSVLKKFQAKGVRFGINSNRAFEDISPIISSFNLNGPFILENGAFFVETSSSDPVLAPGANSDIPNQAYDAVAYTLSKIGIHADIEFYDTTSLFTSNKIFKANKIFINKFRKYSASIHHRIDNRSSFEFANQLAECMQSHFSKHSVLLYAIPHKHGNTVTIESPGVDKGSCLDQYRLAHPDTTIVAIGDGVNDVSLKKHVDYLFAVSNAIPELKEIADYTSDLPTTEGVVDIIKFFLK